MARLSETEILVWDLSDPPQWLQLIKTFVFFSKLPHIKAQNNTHAGGLGEGGSGGGAGMELMLQGMYLLIAWMGGGGAQESLAQA